jgi:hypothetical protein
MQPGGHKRRCGSFHCLLLSGEETRRYLLDAYYADAVPGAAFCTAFCHGLEDRQTIGWQTNARTIRLRCEPSRSPKPQRRLSPDGSLVAGFSKTATRTSNWRGPIYGTDSGVGCKAFNPSAMPQVRRGGGRCRVRGSPHRHSRRGRIEGPTISLSTIAENLSAPAADFHRQDAGQPFRVVIAVVPNHICRIRTRRYIRQR